MLITVQKLYFSLFFEYLLLNFEISIIFDIRIIWEPYNTFLFKYSRISSVDKITKKELRKGEKYADLSYIFDINSVCISFSMRCGCRNWMLGEKKPYRDYRKKFAAMVNSCWPNLYLCLNSSWYFYTYICTYNWLY